MRKLDKNPITKIFSLSFFLFASWFSLHQYRQHFRNLVENQDPSSVAYIDFNDIITPSIQETILLYLAATCFTYGVFKFLWWVHAGKQIDEEKKIKQHDIQLSNRTSSYILVGIFLAFCLFTLFFLLPIA